MVSNFGRVIPKILEMVLTALSSGPDIREWSGKVKNTDLPVDQPPAIAFTASADVLLPAVLEKLQNRAIRIITDSPYDAPAKPLLKQLRPSTAEIIRQESASMVCKAINGQMPAYLSSLDQNIGIQARLKPWGNQPVERIIKPSISVVGDSLLRNVRKRVLTYEENCLTSRLKNLFQV